MSEMMNQGRLQQLKGKVQSTWGNISDDDLLKSGGDKNKLIGTIKEKTGQSEEDIRRKLDEFDK